MRVSSTIRISSASGQQGTTLDSWLMDRIHRFRPQGRGREAFPAYGERAKVWNREGVSDAGPARGVDPA
jgi:hypothetical protein